VAYRRALLHGAPYLHPGRTGALRHRRSDGGMAGQAWPARRVIGGKSEDSHRWRPMSRACTHGRNGCRIAGLTCVYAVGEVSGERRRSRWRYDTETHCPPSGPHPTGQGVCPSGIGHPVTSDAHEPGFDAPSWHFRAVGKSVVNSVGNSSRHPAQMARASEEDSGTHWDSLARSLILEHAAGQTSSRRERSTPQPAQGGTEG
jgi:hypothetical protein